MNLEIDTDVKAVAEHMLATVPTTKLVAVAESLSAIAPCCGATTDAKRFSP
jgi:hypothetical protein